VSDDTKLFYPDLELLLDTGHYNKIIEEISEVGKASKHQLIYKAKALRLLGKNSEALDLLNDMAGSIDLIVNVQNLRERAHILLEMGYYETSETMMNESFEILSLIRSEEPEMKNIKADILHTSGNLLSYKGDFQNALNFWEESLQIKKSQGKAIDQAILENNIAIYYSIIQELSGVNVFQREAPERY